MPDYKFTQSGAEIQALLNSIPNKATLYRHELSFTTASEGEGYITYPDDKIVLISTDSSPYTLNDIKEDDATGVVTRSKILAMYLYNSSATSRHCEPIVYLEVTSSYVVLKIIGVASGILNGRLEGFVSDTVTRI